MRKLTLIFSAIFFLLACNNKSHIGKDVDTQKAISVKTAFAQFMKDGKSDEIVIYGKVADVCQSEGCWFAYELGDSSVTVDFNNEFTVPKNIRRKDLYAVGHFYKDTVDSNDDTKDTVKALKKLITKFRAHGVTF